MKCWRSTFLRQWIDKGRPRYMSGKVKCLAGKILRTELRSMSPHLLGATRLFSRLVTKLATSLKPTSMEVRCWLSSLMGATKMVAALAYMEVQMQANLPLMECKRPH